jgi:putative redox protein
MTSQAFNFANTRGLTLAGTLEVPDGQVRGWALLAHCFTCGKDAIAAVRVSRSLAQVGVGVLRFDFAGFGRSDGNVADMRFAGDVADLVAAAAAMTAAGFEPAIMLGHSLGGAAALTAAASIPSIKAVATIGAPADLSHILRQFSPEALNTIAEHGSAEVLLAGRPYIIANEFVTELRTRSLRESIRELHRPLLVLHSPVDDVVGIENAGEIYLAARHPKSFISLDDADHLLRRPADAAYAATVIAAWAQRYLPVPRSTPIAGTTVIATNTGSGRYQTEIHAANSQLIADEPESAGGAGSGLSPYQLVSAGLSACTVMTLLGYAERKGIPLSHVRAEVDHTKAIGTSPPDVFHRKLSLDGALTEEQRADLLRVATKCPVSLTLARSSVIEELGE